MNQPYFITAIGTPLTQEEQLHEEGLAVQLEDQWAAGIDGILVAGSMGAMQLLSDETYRRLHSSKSDYRRNARGDFGSQW